MSNSGQSRIVSDRYLLLGHLGSGGMGTVWRANDELLGRTVAVKEMRLRARGEELTRQARRAHREARAIAQISHPDVINVYDLVNHEEGLWLVMELVDGPSLAEHVASTGPMTPSAVAAIGLQLLAALEAVHAAGALHRDIKPANVLLRRDGRVVLCDFGIAALAGTDSLTTSGEVVGSLEYIAPERLSDQSVGPASDLFSLGATLCALLFGRSPFARPEAVAVVHAVAYAQPDIPADAELGPLRPLLEALLRKDPAERPAIAEAVEILRPLAMAVANPAAAPVANPVPVAAQPAPGTSHRATRASDTGSRRRRLLRWVVLPAVLLAGGITAGLLVNGSTGASEKGAAETGAADGAPSGKPSAGTSDPAVPAPLTRVDAVMPVPGDPNLEAPSEYWLFAGDRYLRVRVSSSIQPVQESLTPPSPLGLWDDTMGNLPGFRDGIDAVLPVQGHQNEYWVFSRDQYIRIRVAADAAHDDTLVAGPEPISDWVGAFEGLPADGIDAVMPVPDDTNQVWAFSANQYVRTELDGEKPGGRVTLGPSGFDGWRDTFAKTSGFRKGIDAAMPVPGERNEYWVFSGTQYMKIGVADGTYADTVLQGPRTLRIEPFSESSGS